MDLSSIQIPILAQSVIKIMVLIGLGLYTLFAAIIVRQSELMDKVIDETFEPVVRILVILHLLASLFVLFLAFKIL